MTGVLFDFDVFGAVGAAVFVPVFFGAVGVLTEAMAAAMAASLRGASAFGAAFALLTRLGFEGVFSVDLLMLGPFNKRVKDSIMTDGIRRKLRR